MRRINALGIRDQAAWLRTRYPEFRCTVEGGQLTARGQLQPSPRMVKKFMRHSCNTSVARQGARGNALDSAAFAAQRSQTGTGERSLSLDGFSPRESVR